MVLAEIICEDYDSSPCPVMSFGIPGVECPGSTARELVYSPV